MGGSSQTTSNEPWKPVQDPLKDLYKGTENMYDAGVGPQVFPGDRVAPWSLPTQIGVTQAVDQATSGQGLGGVLNDSFGYNIAQGGFNAPMMEAVSDMRNLSAGAGSIDPSQLFAVGGQAGSGPYGQQFQNIASSGGGPNYMKMYTEDMATAQPGGVNPHFQDALDYQMGNAADRVSQYMSRSGRYGSGAMGEAMGRELGGVASQALAQQFNADANRRLQAASGIQDASNQNVNNLINASSGDLARLGMELEANKSGYGVMTDNINRQFQASDRMGGLGQQGQQNLLNFGNAASNVDDLRYSDIDRLFKVGSQIENYQQKLMDETKGIFDEQNQLPWQYAEMFQNILQPAAVKFGSSTTKEPFNPMSLLGIPLAMAGGK
jgi:hypothetical protein